MLLLWTKRTTCVPICERQNSRSATWNLTLCQHLVQVNNSFVRSMKLRLHVISIRGGWHVKRHSNTPHDSTTKMRRWWSSREIFRTGWVTHYRNIELTPTSVIDIFKNLQLSWARQVRSTGEGFSSIVVCHAMTAQGVTLLVARGIRNDRSTRKQTSSSFSFLKLLSCESSHPEPMCY